MSTAALVDEAVPLKQVDKELARRLREGRPDATQPWQIARLSNLVIFCNNPEQAQAIDRIVPDIVAVHPARVLLCLAEPGSDAELAEIGRASCRERVCLYV